MTESAVSPAALAPAKVNLFLHVTGRRADGYHLLDSAFVFTQFGDRLVYRTGDDELTMTCRGDHAAALAPDDAANNLVLRAARALAEATGSPLHGRLELEKRIPVAAGLGGGSADAAATLRLLDSAWDIGLSEERLADIALGLGADVPACLASVPVRVRGIGEALTPLDDRPDWGLLLVNPMVAVPTGPVFRRFRDSGAAFHTALPEDIAWSDPDWLARATANDLEPAAIAMAPVIGDVLDAIGGLAGCRLARMSGSGATCFGLFDTPAAARAAAESLAHRTAGQNWWRWAGGLYG